MSKHQTGHIFKVGRSWYGRWYRNEFENGILVRRQHSEKLADCSNRYRSKKDVKPLLAEKLAPVNEGRCSAESTLSIAKYVADFYFPYAETELKPSTVHGYRGIWRMYLQPRLGKVSLRDFTCGQATKLLAEILRDHKLSTKSLRHCKGLLQTIFSHAKQTDVLFGDNPIKDAKIPKAAVAANKTPAYTVEEIMVMLHMLTGTARAAVGLMYFCALRAGEARGIKWSDYNEDTRILHVKRSVWRKHETGPKTEESIAPVHLPEVLSDILSELPRSEYILATPSGRPIDLHNLAARVIVPSLQRCAVCHKQESEHDVTHKFELDTSLPEWKGFYALRRGIATALADVAASPVAAKSHLRHSNIATTMQNYIKSVDTAAVRAVDKINALFDNVGGSGRPN